MADVLNANQSGDHRTRFQRKARLHVIKNSFFLINKEETAEERKNFQDFVK